MGCEQRGGAWGGGLKGARPVLVFVYLVLRGDPAPRFAGSLLDTGMGTVSACSSAGWETDWCRGESAAASGSVKQFAE